MIRRLLAALGALVFSQAVLAQSTRSIFNYLTPADVAGIQNRDGVDRHAVLQSALNAAGAGNIKFPDGLYVSSQTLLISSAQNLICGGQDGGAGASIAVTPGMNTPLLSFNAAGGVRGCNLLGNVTSGTQNGQILVYINGVNNVILDDDFFSGGYTAVATAGNPFYISIRNSYFTGQYRRFLDVSAPIAGAGADLILSHVRFLAGASTMDYGWHLDGLGSLIASDVVLSTTNFMASAVYFDRPASLFGGAQISNGVFEAGNAGASAMVVGNPAGSAWNNVLVSNSIVNGGTGPAIQCVKSSRLRITGGNVVSTFAGGTVQILPGATCTDFLFDGTAFDGTGGTTVFTTTTNDVTVSGSIVAPQWGGSAPLVDFTATTASKIAYLDAVGGDQGSNANPVRLPVGTIKGQRTYGP